MDTQRQLNILKRAATDPPKLNDEEIVALMKSLRLPLCYFSAVRKQYGKENGATPVIRSGIFVRSLSDRPLGLDWLTTPRKKYI